MPYKDRGKYKEYNKERMRVAQTKVAQDITSLEDVQPDILARGWENITDEDIQYIKSQLSPYIVTDIERIIEWFKRKNTGIEPRRRWFNAYKYFVWDKAGRPMPKSMELVT